MAIVIGLLWNAIRNQGAWLLDHAVVLEAVMGRAVIPLGDIVAVHIDEAMTTLGVQTSTRYVVQSIVAPLALGVRAGDCEQNKNCKGCGLLHLDSPR